MILTTNKAVRNGVQQSSIKNLSYISIWPFPVTGRDLSLSMSMVFTALSCSINVQFFVKWWIFFCFCEPGMFVACWLRGTELDRNVFFPSCLVIRLLPAGKHSDTSQLTAGGTGKSCKLQIKRTRFELTG